MKEFLIRFWKVLTLQVDFRKEYEEEYLAESQDIYDLETRIRRLDEHRRRGAFNYYI